MEIMVTERLHIGRVEKKWEVQEDGYLLLRERCGGRTFCFQGKAGYPNKNEVIRCMT